MAYPGDEAAGAGKPDVDDRNGYGPEIYTVPSEAGNRWDVFQYKNGQLTVINRMS